MKKIITCFIYSFTTFTAFPQYEMRKIDELINRMESGWTFVKKWIDSSKNKVEILPVDTSKAKDILYKTQVSTRSVMGAIVYSTGGLLIDNGWIRILGSGSTKMKRTLPDWNKGKAFKEFGDAPEYFLVADDAVGGYFAINYGSFGEDVDSVYYLSPSSLEWEPMGINYEDFIWFCFNGNLHEFYAGIKWSSWQKDIVSLKADEVFYILPPLWSKEGKEIESSIKKPVPVDELFLYTMQLRKKMGLDKENK